MSAVVRVGSLFSGYGGLDMAVRAVVPAAETAWFCEFEPPTEKHRNPPQAAARVLAHRWPGVPNHGDLTRVDWSAVEPVDVLTGGFPCQDLSHAGKRAGLRPDTRSGLWSHMAFAISVLRPTVVLAENVRGLLSAEADSDLEPCPWCVGDDGAAVGGNRPALRALGAVQGDLADLGYDSAWCGLPASGVGAPHGRFRVFLLAWPADAARDAWRILHGDSDLAADSEDDGRPPLLAGRPEPSRPGSAGRAQSASDAGGLRRGPRRPAGHGEARSGRALGDPAGRGALPTPTAADGDRGSLTFARGNDTLLGALLPTPRATDGANGGPGQRGSSGDLMLPGAVALLPTIEEQRLLPTPSVSDGGGGHTTRSGDRSDEPLLPGAAKEIAVQRLLPTPTARDDEASGGGYAGYDNVTLTDAAVRQPLRWGRYTAAIKRWESMQGPAPSPTMTSSKGNPQLAPAFSEWLMGLPAGHVTDVPGLTRNQMLKALGNGVVPQQGAEALAWLRDHILTEVAR